MSVAYRVIMHIVHVLDPVVYRLCISVCIFDTVHLFLLISDVFRVGSVQQSDQL